MKRDLQMKIDPTPDRAATMQALMGEFTLAARLRGYDVYRRSAVIRRRYAFRFARPDRFSSSQSFTVWSAYAMPNSAIASGNALPVPM